MFKKNRSQFNVFLASLTLLCASPKIQADATQNLLIDKLNQVYLNLAPKDSAKQAVTLRLADLLAERARQNSISELESGCTDCQSGKADRQRSIQLYRGVVNELSVEDQYKVNQQIAHLLSLTGQVGEAQNAYKSLLAKTTDPVKKAEISQALGELHFKNRDFTNASTFYLQALETPVFPSRGYALYRLSWTYFNRGLRQEAYQTALKILNDPKNLTRGISQSSTSVDLQFKEEVVRDMVTFMAQANEADIDPSMIQKHSSSETVAPNLYFLAGELERLGRRKKAIESWNIYKNVEPKPELRVEAMIHLSQLYMEDQLRDQSLAEYQGALEYWSQVQLSEDKAKDLKSRVRNYLVQRTQIEKKNPGEDLLRAYGAYIAIFPNDTEVLQTAAGLEKERKQWVSSIGFYEKLRESAPTPALKEKAVLGELEVAEMSLNADLRAQIYDRYVSLFPQGQKSYEVQYQKAHLQYEQNKYDEAGQNFLNLALLPSAQHGNATANNESSKVQGKAADLALDSLVLAKKEDLLKDWSSQLAKRYPARAAEFNGVSRGSQLKAVAVLIDSNQQQDQAWSQLEAINLQGAADRDKQAYYKNRMIVAERLKKFSEIRSSADQLLALKPSADDQALALKLKSWSCEMLFDLHCAYQSAQLIKDPSADHALRLGILAEISAQNYLPHFSQYLAQSKEDRKRGILALRLLSKSATPEKDYPKYKTILSAQPDLNDIALLRIYSSGTSSATSTGANAKGQSKSSAWVKSQMTAKSQSPTLRRIFLLEDLQKALEQSAKVELNSKNQNTLSSSLKARVRWLESLEKLGNQSIETKDWTSQVIVLEKLKRELSRFYNEVLSLPMPEGLDEAQQGEYLTLLSQTALPYKSKSDEIQAKLNEFWKNATPRPQQIEGWMKPLINQENKLLADVAPEAQKSLYSTSDNEAPTVRPSLAEIEAARRLVQQNPMDVKSLTALASLERKAGRDEVADYLTARINDTKTDKEVVQ